MKTVSCLAAFGILAFVAAPRCWSETNISYTVDLLSNIDGGLEAGTRYIDLFQIDHSWTSDDESLQFFASAIHANGSAATGELVGDAQAVSSLETGFETTRIYEAWGQVSLGSTSLLAGLYDLNGEFDVLDSAGLFLNGAYGMGWDIGQSGRNGPGIYPFTALALRGDYRGKNFTVRLAALDGVPGDLDDPERVDFDLRRTEGAMLIGELEHRVDNGKLLFGAWSYTEHLPKLEDEASTAPSRSVYLRGEYTFSPTGTLGTPSTFFRLGWAEGEVNTFSEYASAGLVLAGALAQRPDDQFGVAFSYSGLSEQAAASLGADREDGELNVEVTYAFAITEKLTIQPNLQYIASPSGDPAISDAVVAGVRIGFSMAF